MFPLACHGAARMRPRRHRKRCLRAPWPEARCTSLEQLATLNFTIDRPPQVTDFLRLHSLACKYQLTAYDVAYPDLAKRLSMPLATLDADLKRAALAEGIEVLS